MSKNATKTTMPSSFEQGLQELNTLVAQMEAGDAPLAHMLASYQRATELLKFCEQHLQTAQEQLKQLDNGDIKPLTL